MDAVEIRGRFITRYNFWNPETWAIPKLYWDTFSQEQRIHAICRQLSKIIAYADYLGVNVDDVAGRLQDIEDGKLDDFIVSAIEKWFNENQPEIMQAIEALQADVSALRTDLTTEAAARETADNQIRTDYNNLLQYKAFAFETVADMKASENLFAGAICHTDGFYSPGDGGAAWYEIKNTGTANELDIIACNDLLAFYIFEGACTFEQFGAYGNGTDNDHDAIITAFSYGNVKPMKKTYATENVNIEISSNFIMDFNGCKFFKIGSMESALFNISPLTDNLIIDVKNAVFDCSRLANYGLLIRNGTSDTDKNYQCIVNVENVEICNPDNENAETVYSVMGLFVFTGTKIVNVSNCHVHDIYRTADNVSIIGNRCVELANVSGSVNVSNNVFENVYKGVNTLDADALVIFENSENADEISVLIENNVFKNSYTRFIKLQCRNVTISKNKFVNTWQDVDLRSPIDFQTAAGSFVDNVIDYEYAPNVTADVDFIKMHCATARDVANVIGNKFISAIPNVFRYFIYAFSSAGDNIEMTLNVLDNYLPVSNNFVRYDSRNATGSFGRVVFNIKNNNVAISTTPFLFIDQTANFTGTSALDLVYVNVEGNKNRQANTPALLNTGYTNGFGNVFVNDNSGIGNVINSSNFDVAKINRAKCFFGTNGSTGGMINVPDNNAHRYQHVEIDRFDGSNNLVMFKSGNANSELSINTGFVVTRS